jgi:signal transduction histidine kinase
VSVYVLFALLNLVGTLALVIWWGHLLLDQTDTIAKLQSLSSSEWARQRRMILSEAFWFLGVLVVSVAMLLVIYWRDARRTRSLQAFFASLTHELKTPLTSVRLQAETLDETEDPDYRSTLSKRLLQDISKLENQVERALELARVEGGGSLQCQSLPVKGLIERALATMTLPAEVIVEAADATISADRFAFQTIMKNLLENAQRHSGASQVSIHVRSHSDTVTIDVCDNGRGSTIAPQQLGQLFRRGEESQGAGVGLYLVRALMKSMNGMIEFLPSIQGFSCRLIFQRGEHA